jgi:hypothetical protein
MAEPIRGRISPYTFLGRTPQERVRQADNADTTLALRQNQLALANVNNSLTRIAEQVSILSASLQGIGNQVKETSAIDNVREQQKARQEKILAERQIREGKESQVETKIQAALVAPLQKVGAKARGSLFNLGRFFNILLGGFLVNRILKSASELSENGQLSLKNLGEKIIKDVAIVGGIFLGMNGGFGSALSVLLRLVGIISRFARRNILLGPFMAMIALVKGTFGGLSDLIKGVKIPGLNQATAAAAAAAPMAPAAAAAGLTAAGQQRPTPTTRSGRSGGAPLLRGRVAGPLAMALNFFTGGSAGESLTAGGLALLPSLLRLGGLPGAALSIALPFLAPKVYQQIQPSVESILPQLGMNKDQLFESLKSRTKSATDIININAGDEGGAPQEVPAEVGGSTYLSPVTSSNPTNFYLMYSQIQYNVVG